MLHHHSKKPHHTFMYVWILGGFAVLISGMVGYIVHRPNVAVAPTQDVIVQPESIATTTLTIGLREYSSVVYDTRIHIDDVVEDSRCGADVTCIQAGTVRLSATIEGPNGTSTLPLVLGTPSTTEHLQITLTDVVPAQLSTQPVDDSQYRFTIVVEKR